MRQIWTEILGVSAVVIGLTYLATNYEALAPVRNVQASTPPVLAAVADASSQMPEGYAPNQPMRDPFAVPAEFQVQPQAMPAAAPVAGRVAGTGMPAAATEPAKRVQDPAPVLTGIVAGGGQYAAIIQTGAASRSYRLNDTVGAYQVAAISDRSVTLAGASGNRVLTLGR